MEEEELQREIVLYELRRAVRRAHTFLTKEEYLREVSK